MISIRSDIVRTYLVLHTWVGVTAGLVLFIAFFAGALTMFKEPIERWATPATPALPLTQEPSLDLLVKKALEQYPDTHKSFTVHLKNDESVQASISWTDSGFSREFKLSEQQWLASLDENNNIITATQSPGKLAELIDMLHRTAGIPGFIGDEHLGIYVLGIVSILYFLAIVSGLIVFLPNFAKDFLTLRRNKSKKRFWLDIHNILGISSLPFHIIISLSAIAFALHHEFYESLEVVVYDEQPLFGPPTARAQPHDLSAMLPVTEILNRVQRQAPEFSVTGLRFINLASPRPIALAALVNPAYMVSGAQSGYISLNPFSGDIYPTGMVPGQEGTWERIVAKFFSLHFGSYGGNTIKWVYFALGLSGAALFYTGNLLWLEKRRKKVKFSQNSTTPSPDRSLKVLAALTVGTCWGSVGAVALTMALSKWMHTLALNINYSFLTSYYTVFLLAIFWAFVRGAARSAQELLIFCSISCLLIPLTSMIAIVFPASEIWAHSSAATIGVDVVAFITSIGFAYAAGYSNRRARTHDRDVWAYS